ncbi:SUKH-4 family immunity protein [Streptomyces sp. NPDC008238]
MDDAELASLLAGCSDWPYPGEWQGAPFSERTVEDVRYAVVALDPGVSAIGLRRTDGSLWLLGNDGTARLLNSGHEEFVAFCRAYEQAAHEAERYEAPEDDDSDEALERAMRDADALTDALVERFRAVDAAAVADENSYWHIAAEELGYSMDA